MKHNYLLIIALLMGTCLLSCSDDEINGIPGEEENYIKVENTRLENIGLMVGYYENEPAGEAKSYPYSIYLYQDDIVYSNEEGLIESGFAHIRLDLNTSHNGRLDEGLYIWDQNSNDVMTCENAWQSTKQVGHQTIDGNRIVEDYESVGLNNPKLHVTISGDNSYEITLEATDLDGKKILAYYKGSISMTMIYSED